MTYHPVLTVNGLYVLRTVGGYEWGHTHKDSGKFYRWLWSSRNIAKLMAEVANEEERDSQRACIGR